jgi:hypothetical protein
VRAEEVCVQRGRRRWRAGGGERAGEAVERSHFSGLGHHRVAVTGRGGVWCCCVGGNERAGFIPSEV